MLRSSSLSRVLYVILSCAALVVAAAPAPAAISVDSNFENGNGIFAGYSAGNLYVNVERIRECQNIWWHFRITGMTAPQTLKIYVYHDTIAGDCNPVYSTDGQNWQRLNSSYSPYTQTFNSETVYIARNIPYTYTKSLELAARMQNEQNVQVQSLCTSEQGRDVVLLRFTDPNAADTGKKLVWVHARQHAFESHGSWVAEGLADWLVSGHPAAAALLKRAIVYVVPIMDVDSVYEGAAGKDQLPIDFNRCWVEDVERWNAVDAVINLIDSLNPQHPLMYFIDCHDPYYAEPHHWHIVPLDDRDKVQEFGDLYVQSLQQLGGANSWVNWYIWHDDQPVTKPTSSCFAKRRWMSSHPRGFSVSMETAHWKDNNGQYIISQGLLDFGKALGLTAHKWVSLLCPDFDGQALVSMPDYAPFVNEWSQSSLAADLNADGIVDLEDLFVLAECWLQQCP